MAQVDRGSDVEGGDGGSPLDHAEIGTWDCDFASGVVTRNDQWVRMLGYEPGEIESTRGGWEALIHPDDYEVVQGLRVAHEAGVESSFEVEHRLRAKSGEWKWILNKGRVIERDAEGRPVRATGIHIDLSAARFLEEERARSESLASIGRLGGKLAHDLNNLLTVVKGNICLAREDWSAGEPYFNEVDRAVERGEELVEELIAFTRDARSPLRSFELRQALDAGIEMAEVSNPIEIWLDASLPPVLGNERFISRALMSVLRNAGEASSGETIRLRGRTVSREEDPRSYLAAGRYVELEIEDAGIESGIVPFVLNPFFSTKPGRLGLGLPRAQAILRQYRGDLQVSSKSGVGTSVRVFLPVADG